MDHKKVAAEILEKVGGAVNVKASTHCATRLRLTLADESLADDAEVKGIEGVINVAHGGG